MKKFIIGLSFLIFLAACASRPQTQVQVNVDEHIYLDNIAISTIDYLHLNRHKYPQNKTTFSIDQDEKFGKILTTKIVVMGGYNVEDIPGSIPVSYKIDYLDNDKIIFILNLKDESISKIFKITNNTLIPISSWSVLNKSNQ